MSNFRGNQAAGPPFQPLIGDPAANFPGYNSLHTAPNNAYPNPTFPSSIPYPTSSRNTAPVVYGGGGNSSSGMNMPFAPPVRPLGFPSNHPTFKQQHYPSGPVPIYMSSSPALAPPPPPPSFFGYPPAGGTPIQNPAPHHFDRSNIGNTGYLERLLENRPIFRSGYYGGRATSGARSMPPGYANMTSSSGFPSYGWINSAGGPLNFNIINNNNKGEMASSSGMSAMMAPTEMEKFYPPHIRLRFPDGIPPRPFSSPPNSAQEEWILNEEEKSHCHQRFRKNHERMLSILNSSKGGSDPRIISTEKLSSMRHYVKMLTQELEKEQNATVELQKKNEKEMQDFFQCSKQFSFEYAKFCEPISKQHFENLVDKYYLEFKQTLANRQHHLHLQQQKILHRKHELEQQLRSEQLSLQQQLQGVRNGSSQTTCDDDVQIKTESSSQPSGGGGNGEGIMVQNPLYNRNTSQVVGRQMAHSSFNNQQEMAYHSGQNETSTQQQELYIEIAPENDCTAPLIRRSIPPVAQQQHLLYPAEHHQQVPMQQQMISNISQRLPAPYHHHYATRQRHDLQNGNEMQQRMISNNNQTSHVVGDGNLKPYARITSEAPSDHCPRFPTSTLQQRLMSNEHEHHQRGGAGQNTHILRALQERRFHEAQQQLHFQQQHPQSPEGQPHGFQHQENVSHQHQHYNQHPQNISYHQVQQQQEMQIQQRQQQQQQMMMYQQQNLQMQQRMQKTQHQQTGFQQNQSFLTENLPSRSSSSSSSRSSGKNPANSRSHNQGTILEQRFSTGFDLPPDFPAHVQHHRAHFNLLSGGGLVEVKQPPPPPVTNIASAVIATFSNTPGGGVELASGPVVPTIEDVAENDDVDGDGERSKALVRDVWIPPRAQSATNTPLIEDDSCGSYSIDQGGSTGGGGGGRIVSSTPTLAQLLESPCLNNNTSSEVAEPPIDILNTAFYAAISGAECLTPGMDIRMPDLRLKQEKVEKSEEAMDRDVSGNEEAEKSEPDMDLKKVEVKKEKLDSESDEDSSEIE